MIEYGKMLDLNTPRGVVVGFGRVKVPRMPTLKFDYEIPLLSFVVIERPEGGHIATCIHMQIDGYGKEADDAISDMGAAIIAYLRENFKNPECADAAWDNLYDLFRSNQRSNILWDKYHAWQIMLAKQGVPSDRYSELDKRIRRQQKTIQKLEADNRKKDEVISYLRTVRGSMVIEYERAA
jgi:hypothetical protein